MRHVSLNKALDLPDVDHFTVMGKILSNILYVKDLININTKTVNCIKLCSFEKPFEYFDMMHSITFGL